MNEMRRLGREKRGRRFVCVDAELRKCEGGRMPCMDTRYHRVSSVPRLTRGCDRFASSAGAF